MKRPLLLALALVCVGTGRGATPAAQPAIFYTEPRFAEGPAERRKKIATVTGEIDQLFKELAAQRHLPGLVWGIVLDGELVHQGATGFADVERKTPAAADTRFRIASMSKSFTALAILKLRDAGKLALDDSVEKFLPDFRAVMPLTADAGPITVRHLLTMTAGFPEDNPWGDRQLARSVDELRDFVRAGVALSNAPGVTFEYSNFAYALLGQIVSQVSGEPYQRFITREILVPLEMRDTNWEYSEVPAGKLALGYRWENEAWRLEPMLHDGTYGAMGGLLTTLPDFARYVGLHLAAWPARDAAADGIVRRATLREMHQPAVISAIVTDPQRLSGDASPVVVGYGYGLRWARDGHNVVNAGHSGGLPGFGSNYRFYPDYGFGVVAFANLTYAGPAGTVVRAGALLINKAKLPRRTLPASPILEARRTQVAELIRTWDAKLANEIVAENFFLDRSREAWHARTRDVLSQAGAIRRVGTITPENQLRGSFPLETEKGRVDVFFTLTPEKTPRVQALELTFVPAGK